MPRLVKSVGPLVIRLALYGCTNRPFYHIVVINQKKARNAKPLEQIGTYDPMPNSANEKLMALNFERLKFYIASGAMPTKPVMELLGLAGFFPVHPMSYIFAKRKRKAQAKTQAESEENTDSTES